MKKKSFSILLAAALLLCLLPRNGAGSEGGNHPRHMFFL